MLRGIVNMLALAALTILGSLAAIATWPFDRSGDTVLKLARIWSRLILRAAGVRVRVEQREPLDPGRPYLFMANHLSMVDIWALYVALPVPVRMIAKKQLSLIPLFGWALRSGRFILIDRQSPVKARRSIDEAARRIAAGASVLLFPEGTRSRDGKLGPFKKGGFHLAMNAAVPVVPVAISGAREVMRRGSPLLYPGDVSVVIGAPISIEGVGEGGRAQLLTRVREEIVRLLDDGHRPAQ